MMLTSSLLVLAVHAEAKFNGADESNLGTRPLLKKEVEYGPYDSRAHPPGWVQQPPPSAEVLVAKAKTSEPVVEGQLAFTFLNSTGGFGDLRLQAASGGVAGAVSSADCAGDDCSWKYAPALKVEGKEYGQLQVKADDCLGTGEAGEYTCCLSWKSIVNDHEGPSTNPVGLGTLEVTKCQGCGEFCDWCREMNPTNHPGLGTDRSFVRLSPSHTGGTAQYCSDACVGASSDATPLLNLRETDKSDTSAYWDCRMEFVTG